MVELAEIQATYYMVAATGVLIAAAYYVMNIRNAGRDRRKQMIMMKLPPMSREYYEWNLKIRNNWKGPEEFDEKYRLSPELESNVWYIMNIYGVLGQLYVEGLMSLEEAAQAYSPGWLISWWEMFEFYIKRIRYTSQGEAAYPEFMEGYERLYNDLKRKYPLTAQVQHTLHEEINELRKNQDTNVSLKTSPY
jgi:hypothetical protein